MAHRTISKTTKRSAFELSRIRTRLVKNEVPKDLWPLFNHLIKLAEDSHKHGYVKRAGIELAHARKLAKHR